MPDLSSTPGRLPCWRGSLQLRLLAGTLTWIVLAVLVSGWGLSSLFSQHVSRQFHAELGMHLDQLAANLVVDEDGEVHLRAPLSDPRLMRPYSGLYWQVDRIAGEEEAAVGILRSRSLWDAVLVVPPDSLNDGELHAHGVRGPNEERLRMIEQVLRPAESPDRPLRLIVAGSEDLVAVPVERFNGLLALALGVLSLGLAGASILQVWTALRPMAGLREGLRRVRDGTSPAIDGRFPSEIQPLVDEFNGVLARNAEIVVRARTQAGNLAHALKTPLAVLANAAVNEEGELAHRVREQVSVAQTQIDHHLARARAAAAVQIPGQRTPVRPVLDGLMRVMRRVHADRDLMIEIVECRDDLLFRGEEQDLQEILGNLIDNACKWALRRIAVRVRATEGELLVSVEDDGPGIDPAVRESALDRGVRIDEQRPGAGLGLSIVRDLVQLYGGRVALDSGTGGGLCASVRLPAG
ncbi:MAG: HAMP domain-containing histidine kinase [Rhodocyclaceae bacterium]|nr:HAMP domain-containing histidine kinase [Rhodocyclaceae bacterium]